MKRILLALAVLWPIFTLCCLPEAQAKTRLPDRNSTAKDTTNKLRETSRQLTDTIFAIEEVEINTGYESIRPQNFVGSAEVLDTTALNRRIGAGILAKLDGTVPGLLFDKKVNTLQIRGISTMGGQMYDTQRHRPLIIVDNFPYDGDLADINENDVAQVTVLKDAAAASIWGARAGNGVIVIQTKAGQFNKESRLAFRSNIQLQGRPNLHYYPQMSSAEFINIERYLFDAGYFNTALNNSAHPYQWPVVSPVVEMLSRNGKGEISDSDLLDFLTPLHEADYLAQLNQHYYREPVAQQYHLSMNGGSDRYAYNLSSGFNNSQTQMQRGGSIRQVSLSMDNKIKMTDALQLGAAFHYSGTWDRTNGSTLPEKQYPYLQLRNTQGQPLPVPYRYRYAYIDTVGGDRLLDWRYIPLDEIGRVDHLTANHALRLSANAAYRILPYLSTEIHYQYQYRAGHTGRNYSPDSWQSRDMVNSYTNLRETDVIKRYPVPMGGMLDQAQAGTQAQNLRTSLRLKLSDHPAHQVNAMVAGELSHARSARFSNRLYGYNHENGTYSTNLDHATNFPMSYASAVRMAIPNGSSYSGFTVSRAISLLMNASYTYGRRYTVYASARRDGANIFGVTTNNRWKPLWSLGGSWDILHEGVDWPPALSRLRARMSYGYTGNVNNSISGLPTISYLSIGANNLNNRPLAQLMSPPNPELRWEQVGIYNIGIDFGFFADRLLGKFDYFRKRSTDLISPIPFDPTTGVQMHVVNSASMKGDGFELALQGRTLNMGNWRWDSQFSLSHAKMYVTEIYGGGFTAQDFVRYSLNPAVGKLAYTLSSYKWAGLDPDTGDPQGMLDGQITKDYAAVFRDSIQNQVVHGSSIPLYSGFLTNTVSWKNLSISANMTYRLNFYFRTPAIRYNAVFAGNDFHAAYADRWQKPGDENHTHVPSMRYPVPAEVAMRDEFYGDAEVHVNRGDNIRLQDLRISWSDIRVPHLGFAHRLQLYFYADNLNLVLWKRYPGHWDADYTGTNNTRATPATRNYSLGINVQF